MSSAKTILLFFTVLGACKTPQSEEKIYKGTLIPRDSKHWVQPVVGFEYCTATIVSTNTIITAMHCIPQKYSDGTKEPMTEYLGIEELVSLRRCLYLLRNSVYEYICSQGAYLNPTFKGVFAMDQERAAERTAQADIAVLYFAGEPFGEYFNVRTDFNYRQNDQESNRVQLMGFSLVGLDATTIAEKGSKQWGNTTISEQYSDELGGYLKSRPDANSVAIDVGDSGGPMFKNCDIIGIASTHDPYAVEPNSKSQRVSFHTALSDPVNKKFLERINNARVHICGLSDTDEKFCPSQGRYRPVMDTKWNKEDLPCDKIKT